jgi:hypothetical protein
MSDFRRLIPNDVAKANVRTYFAVESFLRSRRMLKHKQPNQRGWLAVRCPWSWSHALGAYNKAAIREPRQENEWGGTFKCWECEGKGWAQLVEWVANQAGDDLAEHTREALRQ